MDNMQINTLFGEGDSRYVVIAEGGLAPTKTHNLRWKATREAERLSRQHPGTVFHVAKIKTSLVCEAVNADNAADQSEAAPSLGESLARMVIMSALGSLMRRTEEARQEQAHQRDQSREESNYSGYGRAIPLNTPVYVLVEDHTMFSPGMICPGVITAYANDEDCVIVSFDPPEGRERLKPETVHASRVFAQDDPNLTHA